MSAPPSGASGAGGFYDMPSATDLVEAVREFLETAVLEETKGSTRFHTRVAAGVLAIVERQLRAGPAMPERYENDRVAMGFDTDEQLVDHLRTGGWADHADVVALLRSAVAAKLLVDNPTLIGDDT